MDHRVSMSQYLWNSYTSIPLVTRLASTFTLVLTLAVNLDILSKFDVYFNPTLTFHHLQLWRLITCFFYMGQIDIFFLFNIIFSFRYCYFLETHDFAEKRSDFVLMFFFGITSLLLLGYATTSVFLDQSLSMMLFYIWARRNPQILVELFGFIIFRAVYLPLVFLALSIIFGHQTADFIGFFVGHTYYVLYFVFPQLPCGFPILEAPNFLKRWCGHDEEEIDIIEEVIDEIEMIEPPVPISLGVQERTPGTGTDIVSQGNSSTIEIPNPNNNQVVLADSTGNETDQ